MERFNLVNMNDVEVNNIRLKPQGGLQLWKTWMMMMYTLIGLGKY
jgi:hypothetical protein